MFARILADWRTSPAVWLAGLAIVCGSLMLFAQEPPRFRTDADGPVGAAKAKKSKGKEKPDVLDWYQLVDGKFPPAGSAHAVSGELIAVDHLERRFQLRVDRNDSQDRGVWDLPIDAVLLPYGAIYYHGAPAALQDIPLGTHLHGLFYVRSPQDKTPLPATANNRQTPEAEFRRCFQLADDFSFYARQKQQWKVEAIDLATKKLTATRVGEGVTATKPQLFDLLSSTRVFQGKGFAEFESIAAGQLVQLNLTWSTLYGPGRITDIWLDATARERATARQLERHRNHIRERGLAGWVDAVDDEAEIVTVTFFDGVEPSLFDEITKLPDPPASTGTTAGKAAEPVTTLRGSLAVARESLQTYDPVNDRKGCAVLEVKRIAIEPGSSGVQVRLKCDMLLEGFRPRRIVRFYPSTWKVIALPREEQYFGRE